jgi:hypothetical protein
MSNERSPAMHAFRLSVGTLGWTAIVVQLVTSLTLPTGPDALTRTVNYFSFFTILSNILAAATLTVPELAGRSRVGRFLLRYELRTALTVYMIMTGCVYALFLAGLTPLTEVQHLADIALHYVIPPLYVIDWIAIRPKCQINWKNALNILIFPLLYGVYTLARGALVGTYPYPFVDVNQLGYRAVLINFGLFVLAFLGLSIIIIAVGRRRALTPTPVTSDAKDVPEFSR